MALFPNFLRSLLVLCVIAVGLSTSTASFAEGVASATSIATKNTKMTSVSAHIKTPDVEQLKLKLKKINDDASISEEAKKHARTVIQNEIDMVGRYRALIVDEKKFDQEVSKATVRNKELEKSLNYANSYFTQEPPAITETNLNALQIELDELTTKLSEVQDTLNEATATYTTYQALPTRAQTLITENTARLNEITKRLNDPSLILPSYETDALKFEKHFLQRQMSFLQKELKSVNTLQDIANYKIRINTLHKDYLTRNIANIQAQIKRLQSSNPDDENDEEKDYPVLKHFSEIEAELNSIDVLEKNIDKMQRENDQLTKKIQDVESALNATRQISKNLNEQLSDLSRSLILSRLLNRQQSAIPHVDIGFNLDERIPNLNLWMYDLRSHREEIFDIQSVTHEMIYKNPKLAPYESKIANIVRHRRDLYDELYLAMSNSLTLSIKLRAKNTELQNTTSRVNGVINDHLFWLASNSGLSTDFFTSFIRNVTYQTKTFFKNLSTPATLHKRLVNFLKVVIPLLIIGLIFYKAKPFFKRKLNILAMRLDKADDNYLVTPTALIYNIYHAVPLCLLITCLGEIVIFTVLNDFHAQKLITCYLILHLFCFLIMRQIMGQNSLVQRHFAGSPSMIAQNRTILDHIWFISIPMLLIANIRLLDPTSISGDIIGYSLTMAGFLYLTIFAIYTAKRRFDEYTPTMTFWILSAVGILTPLTLSILLGLGYYYTVIQVLNRVAITLYIGFLYLICSLTLRREMHVAESRMIRQARLQLMMKSADPSFSNDNTKGKRRGSNRVRINRNARTESQRLELVNSKAFNLFNALLMTIFLYFMYLQWSDLAGVLSYLDHIYIWTSSSIVDGKTVITNHLSLGNILFTILIIIVTTILTHNLPMLIERLFLLKNNGSNKSTIYTFKIITSYVITAIGIILAAGALGISWDDLQWLVAALSVGLGFGLQEIFANFISGIIILFERQLRVGDIVTLGDLSGKVNKIRIRATSIVAFDNKEVVIPNRQFITSALTNWSLSNTITKLEFAVGIAYGADVNKAKDLLRGIIRRCRYLNREKESLIYVKSLDASAVTIMCEVFVDEISKRKPTFDYLSTETLRIFAEQGIEIPFDQLDITIRNLDNGQVLTESASNTTKS